MEILILVDRCARHSAFVEVERDTDKNNEQRQASSGKLFVVCDNSSCMRNIRIFLSLECSSM